MITMIAFWASWLLLLCLFVVVAIRISGRRPIAGALSGEKSQPPQQAATTFYVQTRPFLQMTLCLEALADERIELEVRINKDGQTEICQLISQAA